MTRIIIMLVMIAFLYIMFKSVEDYNANLEHRIKAEKEAEARGDFSHNGGFNPERQWYLESLIYSAYKEETDIFDEAFGRPFYRGDRLNDPYYYARQALIWIANKEGWEYYSPGESNIVYKPKWYDGTKQSYMMKQLIKKATIEEDALEELGEYWRWYDNCPCSYRVKDIYPEQFECEYDYRQAVFHKCIVGIFYDCLIMPSIAREAEIFGLKVRDKNHYDGFTIDKEKYLDKFERIRGWYLQYKNFDPYVYEEQVKAVDQVHAAWKEIKLQETENDFEKAERLCDSVAWGSQESIIKLQIEVVSALMEEELELCCDPDNVIAPHVTETVAKCL